MDDKIRKKLSVTITWKASTGQTRAARMFPVGYIQLPASNQVREAREKNRSYANPQECSEDRAHNFPSSLKEKEVINARLS